MFNEITRMKALESLSREHKIAFASSCCERLLPYYQGFYKTEKWGNLQELRGIVDTIWGNILGVALSASQLNELVENCINICPDTEVFSSLWAAPALCACVAIISTLECYLDGSASKASQAGGQALEAIYIYLYAKRDPELGFHAANESFENKLAEAPMIKAELSKQEQDLKSLSLIPLLTIEFLEAFRSSSLEAGIQSFKSDDIE